MREKQNKKNGGVCSKMWGGVCSNERTPRVFTPASYPYFRAIPASPTKMLANLARAAARPSLGLVQRAAAATKCPTATPAAVSVPRNLRCASTLTEVLKAEIEEERLVQFDEGKRVDARQRRPSVCMLRGVVVRFFLFSCCFGFNPNSYGWFRGPDTCGRLTFVNP